MEYRVDIDLANRTKSGLSRFLDGRDRRLLNRVGAFAALFELDVERYRQPVLVLKTEEPGSKQLLAFRHDRVESVCRDMIHHLINDCIVMGAEPLAVQDLIVCGRLDAALVDRVVSACADACAANGCVLTGGETSEQPGVLGEDTYILGSSIVGVVERDRIIDGQAIRADDVVIAIQSSGPHTNGYTLIRDLLAGEPDLAARRIGDGTFLEAVLEPHRCYYPALRDLFATGQIRGMAHITGGGIRENLNRILPQNVDAAIDLAGYRPQPVFAAIRQAGGVADETLLRTFNLGVGMAVVCAPQAVAGIIEHLTAQHETAYVIGRIVSGTGQVACHGSIAW